ncbi:MAG: molybdopterin biosynthesis protein [Candidatus Izemoplasmataceae bacterium]
MRQNIYLKNTPLNEVEALLKTLAPKTMKTETIPVQEALGRVTAKNLFAKVSSPCYNASAMDGVALKASDTEDATESNPITIKAPDFKPVNTGNIIEEPFNAVVMSEDIIDRKEHSVTIIKAATPFQHIRPIGEDIVEQSPILPKTHTIRPIDISALLSGGLDTIEVVKEPRVMLIPTGDEIIRDVGALKKGKIIDSNSFFLTNSLKEAGAKTTLSDVVKDDFDVLEKTMLEAAKAYDIVLVGAGSSAGTKDFTKHIIEKHGTVHVHGIAIKPGKPTVIGTIEGTPVIGVPGYPVSTTIAFELVIRPLVAHFSHKRPIERPIMKAKLAKKLYSSLQHSEYVRVKLAKVKDTLVASPLNRGAGVTMSVVQADGLLVIPKNKEGDEAGETADVLLLNDMATIERSLTIIGSHDILIDELDPFMRDQGIPVSSIHVGSFGGIMAMKTNECHLAPIHLLGEGGEYNTFVLGKYLDESYALIRGVGRIQGLYVKKGNPKGIKGLKDLSRSDVRLANRQRGSGTRILLDYLLDEAGIDKGTIEGYTYELPTHTMVATSVLDDRYDAGMGVESVANIYALDFIRIGEERYDFIVPKTLLETDKIKTFIKTLKNPGFLERLEAIGGYTFKDIGTVIEGKKA